MENPLNFYGPFIPPMFESKVEEGGGGGTSPQQVQNMIDESIKEAAFVIDVDEENANTSDD